MRGMTRLILVVLMIGLTISATPTMAQEVTPPVVDWPSEARFVAEPTPMALVVPWPSEARFVAEPTPMALVVPWPSEARFVADAAPMALLVPWPSEARFAEQEGLLAGTQPLVDPTANKVIYRDVAATFFGNDDATLLFAHYDATLAQLRFAEWVEWQEAFSDLDAALDFQIAEGDRVLSCWTFHGIHSGEFMGVAPTGRPVSFTVLYTARLVDGQVVEEIGQLDLRQLLDQLGA
ncbi:MAG: ester cyclase [Caldilineaceae bacterium]|nr:ester cyclase [Caldilineaceae bacterium]